MTAYRPLTKIISDGHGNESVACQFYGTDNCRSIHEHGCTRCPMMAAILNQLHCFEKIFLESAAGGGTSDKQERNDGPGNS